MAVITFSQEFGSGGREIAKRVAEELRYSFADKGVVGDLLGQYGLVEFKRVYDSTPAFWESLDSQKMEQRQLTIEMMNRAILALAQRDNAVIVGRGGYLVLAGFDDVLNVRIQAPFGARVTRVMLEKRLSDRALAENIVRENDSRRERFIEFAYGSHRDRAIDFNLVLDVEKIPESRAVALIAQAAKDIPSAVVPEGKYVASIVVDNVLKDVIAKLF